MLRNALSGIDRDALAETRLDLAACLRQAARLGLHEGVCNHFSAMVPGSEAYFVVNPLGYGFHEATASRLLVCDFDGNVVEGEGEVEATAFFIHARLHRHDPRARVAFHTHMPNATALAMLEGPPLSFAIQSSLKFHGRIAVDEDYQGLALDSAEGDRIARAVDGRPIVFLKNHGVMVTAPTIAEAWDDLYYLERACEAERIALSTGRPLKPVPPEIAARTAAQMRDGAEAAARRHLTSVRRTLDREAPDYRH